MKKFNFKYKRLKKIRKIQEELANKEYQIAATESRKQADELNEMYDLITKTREFQLEKLKNNEVNPQEFVMQTEFFTGQKVRIENKTSEVRSSKQIVEDKLDILFDKHKSRKQIEKLEEKKKTQYNEEYKYHQLQVMEDIFMTRIKKGENT